VSALKDQRHTVRISRAAPQPFLLLPQALPGRAHPSQRRSSTSRHRHVLPARARRRQLHSDVAHADHAPSSHWKIEHKTASLLLYALQTASTNLRQTKFDPRVHEVILDPRDSRNSPLDTSDLWDDEDFEEEEEEELDEVEREIEEKCEEAARKARHVARWEAKKEIEARERARKRFEDEEKLKVYVEQHPEYMLVREDGRLKVVQRPKPEESQHVGTAAIGRADERQLAQAAKLRSAGQPEAAVPTQTEKKPAASDSAGEVRKEITSMIREKLPELTKAYNEALKREAEKQSMKKEPQKETLSNEVKKKAT
jgi:hypothetical protein